MMIPEMVPAGLFSEGAFNRPFQIVNSAVNRLFQGAFPVRDGDRLAAVAARLDHAAFVTMAGIVAYSIAKVHIGSPDTVAVVGTSQFAGAVDLPRL